jgi:hypothetical protein
MKKMTKMIAITLEVVTNLPPAVLVGCHSHAADMMTTTHERQAQIYMAIPRRMLV